MTEQHAQPDDGHQEPEQKELQQAPEQKELQQAPERPEPQQARELPDPQDLGADATGDIVIDAALRDLRDAPDDDLDAQIEAGRRVQQTLQSRLGDLGGE